MSYIIVLFKPILLVHFRIPPYKLIFIFESLLDFIIVLVLNIIIFNYHLIMFKQSFILFIQIVGFIEHPRILFILFDHHVCLYFQFVLKLLYFFFLTI